MELEEKLLDTVSGIDQDVKGVWIGLTWTAVESLSLGLSHTYRTDESAEIEKAGILSSLKCRELAGRITSWNTLEASVGVAAINSLIEPKGEICNVKELLKSRSRGKTVTFVGRFPFYDEIAPAAKKAYILELQPVGNELPSSACEEILPMSDINIITGTALINHTLQRLLELGENGINIILGPTTPLSTVLFDFGADIIGGIRITDKEEVIKGITQGVRKAKLLNGIERVCMFNDRKNF